MSEPAPEIIKEFDVVALLVDLPSDGMAAGHIGAIVFVHDGGEAFEVEFTLKPRRSVVATVPRSNLLKLRGICHPPGAA